MTCTSGSVVEYRLAKARVAGSNPVSCFFIAIFYLVCPMVMGRLFSLTGNYAIFRQRKTRRARRKIACAGISAQAIFSFIFTFSPSVTP